MMVDVNNKEIREYSKQLRKMHRSNFSIVARQTLNDLAFDVKKNTLLQSADKEFILRNPSFFKKHSGVKMAIGLDINSMKSEVGIVTTGESGDKVAKELQNQEYGGKIKHQARYLKYARSRKSRSGRVKSANILEKKGYVEGIPSAKRGRKANFVAESIVALREDKYLNKRSQRGKDNLLRVDSIQQNIKTKKIKIKLTGIAELEQEGKNLKARPFLYPASLASHKKADSFFIRNAKKRLK